MPVDHETVGVILARIDERFTAADKQRSDGFRDVYGKIDEHAERSDAKLDRLAERTEGALRETAVSVARVATQLENHVETTESRFAAIGRAAAREEDVSTTWKQTAAKILLSSAVVAGLWEWVREAFKR